MKRLLILLLVLLLTGCGLGQVAPTPTAIVPKSTIEPTRPPATNTPEPTHTTMPLPTDTAITTVPTATLAAPKATVLAEVFQLINSNSFERFGSGHVVGVYRYIGSAVLPLPEISVTLRDENDNILASAQASGMPTIVKPGTLVPFRAMFSSFPKEWRRHTIQIQPQSAEMNDLLLDMYYGEYEVLQSRIVPLGSRLKVAGEVRNNGDKTGSAVQVSGVIYDKEGKVLDAQIGFTTITTLTPGATSAFEIQFIYHESAERYDLVVSSLIKR